MHFNRKPHKVFYGWWIVGACSVIALYVGGTVWFGFTAVFEPIAKEFGWSYTKISLAASLRGLEAGLLAPIVGFLVDRWGPRRLMIGGSLFIGLGLILLSRITSLSTFYGVFVLIAIGMSTCGATVTTTAVANWFHRKVGRASGIAASGVALGGLLVPGVSLLIDKFEWRMAMLILGLGMWVIGLPLSLLARHKPEQYGYLPDGELSNSVVVDQGQSPAPSNEVDIQAKQALTNRTFWHIALAFMCHSFLVGAVITHVMPYLSSISVTRSTSSLVASAIPLASIVGRLSFGWLGDRLDKRWVTAIGAALTSFGLLFFSYAGTVGIWLLVPFLVLFGVGWGGQVTMRAVLVRECFGRVRFGTILGFIVGAMAVGNIGGPPLAGWVFDTWGSYQGIWLVLAALAMVGAVILLTTPRLDEITRPTNNSRA